MERTDGVLGLGPQGIVDTDHRRQLPGQAQIEVGVLGGQGIIVDFKGFKWLIQTTDFSPVGARIGVKIDPDGFHIMKKSRYSGMFGDYSSYSSEYDELNEGPEEGIEDEE